MASKTAPPRLGRGLAALLGESGPQTQEGAGGGNAANIVLSLPIDQLDANPFQPRMEFRADDLDSLAESIRVQGVLQPILVRRHPAKDGRFQIIAGERRFRAATQAGLTEVPALLRDMDDSDTAIVALVENLQRQDLNALEEAEGFQRLLDDFGLTHEALGYAVSKSRSHIGNTIRLLKLPDTIKKEIRTGTLSSGHARALINAPDPEALAEQVIRRGMSVRQTEAMVSKLQSGAQSDPDEPRERRAKQADLLDLERQITDSLGCRVMIALNRKGGGDISITFRDHMQLEEIVQRLKRQLAKAESLKA